jgi:DNA gyrase subunit A
VTGVNAINITEDDELIDVQITSGSDEVILATYEGMAIRFHESDVREMGRVATGVRGIRLRPADAVVGMVVVGHENRDELTLLVVTEKGRGKRTRIDDYRFQSRGGMGVINFRINDATGKIVAIKGVKDTDELMLITRNGVVNRQRVNEIRVIGRATQGVRIMALDDGDQLMDVACVVPEDESVALDGDAPDAFVAAVEDIEIAAAGGFVDDEIPAAGGFVDDEIPDDTPEFTDDE